MDYPEWIAIVAIATLLTALGLLIVSDLTE